ncbi:septation protein IspZ [Buchnera aphidicola]|uniref:Inner membrane-spanning protein YciB n=1 Tax=Buchnera aphidicola subsp. Melaphis rhois TaxID=118103 RepID=A0A4D6Y3V6_BUCMH|nr:septation protein IspZ [Buchnera aphidicola]QCI23283.1 septation protein IspZ [Buchnera aphidicola (Melaphis rhois)]
MKQLLNFVPIFSFFIVYKFYNIFLASTILMILTISVCILFKVVFNNIDKMDYINCICVLFFGSLTLLFHNSNYIKWKVTIIYLFLFLSFLINHLLIKKPLIQQLLGKQIRLTDSSWNILNIIWSIFFLICAIINLYVMFYFSESMWVLFKVFGLTFLTLFFIFINIIYIYYLTSRNK